MAFVGANAQLPDVPIITGNFQPSWESTEEWECPEWFKDAKFGIWAHWGPQNHPEAGDWYARHMYYEGGGQSNHHINMFGWMGDFGWKDVCNSWKADEWDPDALIELYKSTGARYFMTLGNHHDNFDLWDSPYQEWNSAKIGPKRNIVKEWADACEKYGLPLGVSFHASHTWTWMEISQLYDGNLTKEDGYKLNEDGTEKWWKGLDPQELYAQNHTPSIGFEDIGTIHSQWAWSNGASLPSEEYKQKFLNRTLECINTFNPDMIYFDDTVLPFWGCDESVGLNILSHYYNKSAQENGGQQQVVVTGKVLESKHKKSMLWDIERGIPDRVQEDYWQTCTCIGGWHYNRADYNAGNYKSAQQVVSMLVDIVSKNGNLLLSVPLRSNGVIDEKVMATVQGIKEWMEVNSVSIYGTRPWKTFGEGPLAEASNPLNAQGFNEGNNYSSADVRYVQRNDTVFATTLRYPGGRQYTFEAFGLASKYYSGKVKSVTLLGHGPVDFVLDIDGLTVTLPTTPVNKLAAAFAIEFDENSSTVVTLEELITIYEEKVQEMRLLSGYDTGKFSRTKVNEFAALVETHKASIGADEVTQQKAIRDLNNAYKALKDAGVNEGGAPNENNSWDYTTDILLEASNFSRLEETGTRFAAPLNWTVENFNIPNGGDGVKAGLDRYEGNDALMLGVWNDRDANTDGELSNARIYRKVHLEAGRYYFGARFNAVYQLSDAAYIFAANETMETSQIPNNALAYARLNKAVKSGPFYGIYFTLEKEQDVILGFQVDLLDGSSTQEFRADEVKLLYYGTMDYITLENLILEIDAFIAEAKINNNTGFYSKSAIQKLQAQLDEAMKLNESSPFETIIETYNSLNAAYLDFKENGKNQGGAPSMSGAIDITVDILKEAANFERTEETLNSGRFGAPKNWTVENFGFGNQAGIDNDPGHDCLALEVWWNSASYAQNGYDISNVRIYQQVTLPAGRYFFGASYRKFEPNEELYIFASDELVNTSEIPTMSIAYEKVNIAPRDGTFRGITFELAEESTIYLGFQADFTNCNENNLRASEVKLLYYGEMTYSKLETIIADYEELIKTCKINNNTGYYSQKAYEAFVSAVNAAKEVKADASADEISLAINALNEAYTEFITNGKNPGGIPEDIGANDITEEYLIEKKEFSRVDPSVTTRFSIPKYWNVDNFHIETPNEGIRGGLDKYPGYDCLMIGVWEDMHLNVDGDLTNSCVYRKVKLEAGQYYFGAAFNALHNMNLGYMYVANNTLNTTEIDTQSIAYYRIADCKMDGNFHGLYFTLDEPQEVVIAFQVDVQNGPSTQEFRASEIVLYSYGQNTSIESVEKDGAHKAVPNFRAPAQYYSITGQQLNAAPRKGLFIMRQGGNTFKIFR